ncbi:MAG TPA: hypothetical protein VFL13_09760, partial [Candidatus Baltobacteraceae bacterium]|nr:hypothetical protein [Candidatus Baltobacteraceae bacterium]
MIAGLVLAALSFAPSVHHRVSTVVPAAQAAFDRGLLLYYAYNGDAAYEAFAAALQRDPHLAMAAWGEAIAAGPDLNTPMTQERFDRAAQAAQRAVALESYASPQERAYIDAAAARYAGTFAGYGTGNERYLAAMQQLTQAYPSDNDAQTIYAEALMESNIGDLQARSIVTTVLARDPAHVLANHLCIHSYDYAPDHTPALTCANRISRWTFEPAEVHLAHMPAHTYITLGMYAQALSTCNRSWQLRESTSSPLKYAAHDAYTGFSVAMMRGDLQSALLWSQRAGDAYGGSDAWATFARFGVWDRIGGAAPQREFYAVLASGLAALHRGDTKYAQNMLAQYANTDADYRWILEGAIADAQGRLDDAAAAYTHAIDYQAREDTGEQLPLFPAGEFLGAMYLHHAR